MDHVFARTGSGACPHGDSDPPFLLSNVALISSAGGVYLTQEGFGCLLKNRLSAVCVIFSCVCVSRPR